MIQDLVIGFDADAGGVIDIPDWMNYVVDDPEFTAGADGKAVFYGVGWAILIGFLFAIIIGMVIVGFVFFFVPPLRAGMPAFASFAIMLMAVFIVAFMVILKLTEVFG